MPRLFDDPNDPRWLEAERRDIFLRGLLNANDWTATREAVEAVRNEFRIGRSTVYRMIARFRASRKASSLIPAGRGTRLDQMAFGGRPTTSFRVLWSAILRSLPLRRPSVLSVQNLRTLARATDGITAKVFSMLNELAVEAVRSRKEQITEDVESWEPALEREAVFA